MSSSKKPRKKYVPKPQAGGFALIAKITGRAHMLTPSNKAKASLHVEELRKLALNGQYTKNDADQLAYAAALYEKMARAGYGELQGKWLDHLCKRFEDTRLRMIKACENAAEKSLKEEEQECVNDVLIGFMEVCKIIPEAVFFSLDNEVRDELQIKWVKNV